MKFVYNNSKLKNRRKSLRKDSTETENILWQKLRKKNLGYKFFRQYSLEGYVMDFYCPEKRLAIEIDGGYHQQSEVQVYDKYRQRYLEAFDVKILRIRSEEVVTDMTLVIKKIGALLLE